MKKRKNDQSTTQYKKLKPEIAIKVLNFCSKLNAEFRLTDKEKITEENLKDFIDILNDKPVTNEYTNDLYILHYLAQKTYDTKNTIKFAEYFIKSGIEADKKNNAEHTPLTYAAINENTGFINLLINNKANVNSQNIHGNTILHNVIKRSDNCRQVIEKLIAAGANIELQNNKNQTPVEHAFELRNSSALLFLLEHGAKITDKMNDDIYKINPLDEAHAHCQDLVYLATIAWDLLTTDEIEQPIKVSEEKFNRFDNLVASNSILITKIAQNIIISSPKDVAPKRLSDFQENFKTMNMTTVVSSELFFEHTSNKDVNLSGEFEDY